MNNTTLAVQQPTMTPPALLRLAVEKGADVTQLTQLMDLQLKWEANEARKAYDAAMAAFKESPPKLTKNKQVRFQTTKGVTEYRHATLDQVSATIGEALSKHGITHRWDVEQPEKGFIRVTCVLTHVQGHSERVAMSAGADESGSKNSIQALGSTVTYLQRYTLLAATGMAVEGQDDDARTATGTESQDAMPESQLADFTASIEEAADIPALQKAFVAAYTAAQKAADKPAMRRLTEAKDVRKKALGT